MIGTRIPTVLVLLVISSLAETGGTEREIGNHSEEASFWTTISVIDSISLLLLPPQYTNKLSKQK